MNEDCLFCKIAGGTLPATMLHQDERCVAFADIFPKAPVHILVVPREHVESALQASKDPGLVGHLVVVAGKLAESQGLGEKGFRLVMNTGKDAGQTVDHLHLHLLGGHALGGMG